jgi:hypothetical protein
VPDTAGVTAVKASSVKAFWAKASCVEVSFQGLLAAPRMVRGRPSQVKGAFGVAARSLRDP